MTVPPGIQEEDRHPTQNNREKRRHIEVSIQNCPRCTRIFMISDLHTHDGIPDGMARIGPQSTICHLYGSQAVLPGYDSLFAVAVHTTEIGRPKGATTWIILVIALVRAKGDAWTCTPVCTLPVYFTNLQVPAYSEGRQVPTPEHGE